MSSFGDRLRSARLAMNMSQAQLSKACGFKGRSSIGHLESGLRRAPDVDALEIMASSLNVSPAWLAGWEIGGERK